MTINGSSHLSVRHLSPCRSLNDDVILALSSALRYELPDAFVYRSSRPIAMGFDVILHLRCDGFHCASDFGRDKFQYVVWIGWVAICKAASEGDETVGDFVLELGVWAG